jgi:hypothetical protein
MDKKDEDAVAVKVDRTQVFQEARVFNVSPMWVEAELKHVEGSC